jgi:hypothetical protein
MHRHETIMDSDGGDAGEITLLGHRGRHYNEALAICQESRLDFDPQLFGAIMTLQNRPRICAHRGEYGRQ